MVRSITRTAGFNFASALAAGLGGIIFARAVGPTVRGEYAAVTSWFGVVLMVGGMGQPAALCFHVAKNPDRAREYVATSRAMMLTTGAIVLTAGVLLAPILAHRNIQVTRGYQVAFGASILAFVGASYTFSLQARDLRRWNVVRVSQPVMSVIAVVVLWRLRKLTLDSAMIVLAATMLVQLIWAYNACRSTGLAPGQARRNLVRPLATYGFAQIAALTPAAVNAQLDQLVLSQTVPAADLGHYAVAVSLTLVPIPLVSAIGYVAFPRLAAQRTATETTLRVQRLAVLGSAGLTAAMLVPLALVAHWMVPFVFGPAYRGAVPLLWILTPGSVFLACGGVVSDVLRGRNRPIVVAWSQGLAAVFTVVLLVALLPLVGVYGAAIASTISYGIALAVMLRYLWRLPGGGSDDPQAQSHFASPIRESRRVMRISRRAAINVTDFACRTLGRHRVLRAGRLMLYRARLDVPNDLTINGEKNLQRWVAGLSVGGTKLHVVDVGANVGNWSESMVSAMRQAGRLEDLRLDAFEPSTHTFTLLSQRVKARQANLYRTALSDRTGSSILYVTGLGSGTNSLHAPAVPAAATSSEKVDIGTLDDFADRVGLQEIALLKVDTEGHDLAVLRGAGKLFAGHRILVVQFEYNHRWVLSRNFLRDAFELLQPKGYWLGKLTPKGVEFYSRWDPDLETFVEGNYVACLPEVGTRLPSVSWWKPQPALG